SRHPELLRMWIQGLPFFITVPGFDKLTHQERLRRPSIACRGSCACRRMVHEPQIPGRSPE
ncbi:MAG: hypothetical protein II558_04340, partial [Treponema sp.]|nr:hypothetical protein [Treponema sp.]